ncbi:type II secretion system protein GspL [Hyphomonas oceanitis]|uniref:General secretion pathway L n=1 Tax=Hyphomonas oceanitis SCH89 TaxID=1280953 RepID=A0A059G5N7_9PROT|nr:type II secretion system protein GspL [Hyphomonas oceanitis]KDA01870.1 general secretion pathway L [Hyphomonas oceanitis SCH89]
MQPARGVAEPTDGEMEPPGLRSCGGNLPILLDPNIMLVPSERVRLAAVALPLKRADQRRASLPFAMEPFLGEPIEQCHFATGGQLEDGRYLACAVNADQMALWAKAVETSAGTALIVPDVLVLPIPPFGVWHVARLGERVLVRLPDGSGFATRIPLLPIFAKADGSPECRIILDQNGPSSEAVSLSWPARADLLNLRQGLFAARVSSAARSLNLAAITGLVLVMLTSLIASGDLLALQHIAHNREARLIADFRERFPETPVGTGLIAAIDAMNSRTLARPPDLFLSTLSATSLALQDEPSVSVQTMAFTQAARRLDLSIETDSLDTFQSLESRLDQSGIAADLGAATSVPGGAEGRLSVIVKDVPQ